MDKLNNGSFQYSFDFVYEKDSIDKDSPLRSNVVSMMEYMRFKEKSLNLSDDEITFKLKKLASKLDW